MGATFDNTLTSGFRRRGSAGVYVLALLFVGCAGHSARTKTAREALSHGDASVALQSLNSELNVASEKQLPEDTSGDNTILLLDRAVVLQQLERYDLSSRDLEVADKQVEMLDFSRSTSDEISRYVFSDDTGPYKAPPYEKLMVNTMNMLNYVLRGDLSGGRVEARRFAVMQKYLKDNEDSGTELLGPGSYLAGFIFEKSGDPESALRYYDEALQFGAFESLEPAIRSLATRSSYRTPRLTKILEPSTEPQAAGATPDASPKTDQPAPEVPSASVHGLSADRAVFGTPGVDQTSKPDQPSSPEQPSGAVTDDATNADADSVPVPEDPPFSVSETETPNVPEEAELLIAINFGRVPAKEAKRVAIGVALAEADDSMDPEKRKQANELSKRGLLTWINYPSLTAPKGPYSTPKARVGEDRIELDLVPVDDLTVEAWEKVRGAVVTSAITRMITRAVAGEVVEKSSDSPWATLLSVTLQVGMSAADTPDTRSWSTLPARIALGRVKVPAGKHTVELSVSGKTVRHEIDLAPGAWEAVGLTVLKQN